MSVFWFVPEIHKSQGWPRSEKRRVYLPKKVSLRIEPGNETIRSYFDSLKFGVRRWEMFANDQSLMVTSRQKEAELLVIGGSKLEMDPRVGTTTWGGHRPRDFPKNPTSHVGPVWDRNS